MCACYWNSNIPSVTKGLRETRTVRGRVESTERKTVRRTASVQGIQFVYHFLVPVSYLKTCLPISFDMDIK